jgi:hypothetical protein
MPLIAGVKADITTLPECASRRHSKTLVPQFNGVAINGGFLLAAAPLAHRPELLLIAL